MGATLARRTRPARGHARGARRVVGRGGGALALRDPVHFLTARLLAARRGHGRRQQARLLRRDRVAQPRSWRPAARGGRVRRLRPGDDRPLARPRPDLRDRGGARARPRARRFVPVAGEPGPRGASADRAAHRPARRRAAASAARPPCRWTVRRLRRRRAARSAQRRLRPALPRASARPRARATTRGGAAVHGRPGASLAHFFGVGTQPCHRALPDAEATAEILVRLIEIAQELGALRLSELRTLAAPRKRRVYDKRGLAYGVPQRPGVYLFRDRHDQVLYVGRARDLRARLRSYFQSKRQRPSVEAALGALHR